MDFENLKNVTFVNKIENEGNERYSTNWSILKTNSWIYYYIHLLFLKNSKCIP